MGSQQGARPTYSLIPPSSPLLPLFLPIALFHPRLIWQQRRRRAGVTKGHCSSSKDTLMPLFFPPSHYFVSLLCPDSILLLPPSAPPPPPCSFVVILTCPAFRVFFADKAHKSCDSRQLVSFAPPPPITHPTHLFVWIQTFHLFVLSWEYELIWNLKYHWECQIRPHIESGFLFNSYMCFSYVWILHIDVWHTAPPPSLLMYSLYFCISWGIIPELINFYFATFCKGDNKRIIKKLQ